MAREWQYARIPVSVLLDPALTLADKHVFAIMSMHVFEGNIACVGQRRLAELAKMDRRSLRRSLTALAKQGHISISVVKLQRRAVYQLNSTIFTAHASAQLGVPERPQLGVVQRPRIDNRTNPTQPLVSFPRKRG